MIEDMEWVAIPARHMQHWLLIVARLSRPPKDISI